MRIRKYIFRDHYKVSTDKVRDIIGFYHDYKDQILTDYSNPKKSILQQSTLKISDPLIVDEDSGLYKQNVEFSPAATDENTRYLNSEFIERTIEDTQPQLIPMRLNLREPPDDGGGGAVRPLTPGQSSDGSSNNSEQPPNYGVPLEPVEPPKPKTNRDVLRETIQNSKHYEDINTIVDEVTDLRIDDSYAHIEAKYNFYVPEYEDFIKNEIVAEETLPNFYVVNLALNRDILDSISQENYNSGLALGATSPYENLYQKFDKFITLDGNLSLRKDVNVGLIFALVLVAYMKQYAEVYDSVSVDYLETVKTRFGHLLTNLTNKELLDKLNEFKASYPMYINIEWTTTTLSPLLVFLQNAGIDLQALQTFLGEKLLIQIKSTTLAEMNRFSILAQSPRLNFDTGVGNFSEYSQELYTYEAGQWISDFLLEIFSGTNADIIHPTEVLVIDQNGSEITLPDRAAQGDAQDIFDILNAISAVPGYQDLLNKSIRSYGDIVNGEFAKSEVLIYKVEKRDAQHTLLQTFYIPNITGINIQNYVDTQVKFNKTYKYKIFAYTVIYGTEYYYERFQEDLGENYYYRSGEGHLEVDTNINLFFEGKNPKDINSIVPTEMTLCCYFRVLDADEGHQLIDILATTSAAGMDSFVISLNGTSKSLNVDNLSRNRWYHLAIVFRSIRTIKGPGIIRDYYIDAKLVGSVEGPSIGNWNKKVFIPGYAPAQSDPLFDPFGSFGQYFTVQRDISNIAIFNRALTFTEIRTVKQLGRCWDLRRFKKGIPPLNIPDWKGEIPALYWRRKDISNIVTNDGYAGNADLVFYGDATSMKCDSVEPSPNAEAQPPTDTDPVIEPRDYIPPLFDVDPIYGDIQPISPVDPYSPLIPLSGQSNPNESIDIPIAEAPPYSGPEGVAGYGEVFIPPPPIGDAKGEVQPPTTEQPPNSKRYEGPIETPPAEAQPPTGVAGYAEAYFPATPTGTAGYGEIAIYPDGTTYPPKDANIDVPVISVPNIPTGQDPGAIGVSTSYIPPPNGESKVYVTTTPIDTPTIPPTTITKDQVTSTTGSGRGISAGGEQPPQPASKKTSFTRLSTSTSKTNSETPTDSSILGILK